MSDPSARSPAPREPAEPRDREPTISSGDDRRLAAHFRTLAALAPGIAHDLRAPINAMQFNLEVLRDSIARPLVAGAAPREPRILRYAGILSEELQRLHEKLEVLISYLRPGGGRPEALSLSRALREIEAALVPTARKRQIRILCAMPDDDLVLPRDGALWRQAILQVSALALARTAAEGELTLTAKADLLEVRASPNIETSASHPSDEAGRASARLLVEAAGGTLREIDSSVSNEPRTTYAIEFPDSRNSFDVSGT